MSSASRDGQAQASSNDIPTLLRFLTRSCSVPLATALKAVPTLQSSNLDSISSLASFNIVTLTPIFGQDTKLCKKIISAAKKEAAGNGPNSGANGANASTGQKRKRDYTDPFASTEHNSRQETNEDDLALPDSIKDIALLNTTVLTSNRAPLLLALTTRLLVSIMPDQPLSSRLSLAQALVSANAKTKATGIGLRTEEAQRQAAENELGRKKVKIMGREVAVMRRESGDGEPGSEALWGLDVDALSGEKGMSVGEGLPIHTPQAARRYLMGAFASVKSADAESIAGNDEEEPQEVAPKKAPKAKKKSRAELRSEDEAEKHRNLALLLGSLNLLFESWSHLSREELDRRAWQWYIHVRPDVASGPGGWGGKGPISLAQILELRK